MKTNKNKLYGRAVEMIDDLMDLFAVIMLFLSCIVPEIDQATHADEIIDEANVLEVVGKMRARDFEDFHDEFYTNFETIKTTKK